MRHSLTLFLILLSALVLEARPGVYPLSRQEPYVYVGIGWRFVYEVNGRLSTDGLEVGQSVFFDVLDPDLNLTEKSCGIGSLSIREFSAFLIRCEKSVKLKKEFKERVGGIEIHYKPEDGTLEINVSGLREAEENKPFISVVIPAEEAANFSSSVKQIAEDYEHINKKLNTAQQVGDGDAEEAP